MADTTLYDTTVPSQGSVALAHQQIIRVKRNGVFENITGDVNNLLPTPTPVTVAREVYGTKGVQSIDKIGDNWVITFSVEGVRDATGAIVQPWLVELIKIAGLKGQANKVETQWFDALDDALPAHEGWFSVSYVPGNTGYADKALFNFTLTSDGVVPEIPSPIAGTGAPIIESVGPALQTVGDQVVIRGYRLSSTSAITIDSQSVAEFIVVDDNTVVAVIPASVTGAAAVVVTNTAGASDPFAYTAATV